MIGTNERLRRAAPVALLALPVLVLAVAAWQRRWMADDGFINLRVVDQVLAGHGAVFNEGERVEVATSPLWIGVLLVGRLPLFWLPLEWEAVLLGIALSLGGVAAGVAGARTLWRALGGPDVATRWWLPAGALVYVALPPAWDFSSSGLETGLSLAWLGLAAWSGASAVARLGADADVDAAVDAAVGGAPLRCPWHLPVLVGLGPLVRPDLGIMSVVLAALPVVLAWRAPGARVRSLGRVAVLGLGLPVLWQVARMGAYGALLPNTVFAKEGSVAWWSQGWAYFKDFQKPYLWALPLWLLWGVALALVLRARARGHVTLVWLLAACGPVLAGGLHVLLVIRAGGDFMHGRLLLPGLFAMLCPVMALPWTKLVRAALLALIWAVVVASGQRVAYEGGIATTGIADERGVYVGQSGNAHPITLEDYRGAEWERWGRWLADATDAHEHVLYLGFDQLQAHAGGLPVGSSVAAPGAVLATPNVGLVSYASGPDSMVVDTLSLGDVVGARQERSDPRGRPGHEKRLDLAWVVARYTPPGTAVPAGVDPAQVEAARRALACGPLDDVVTAATEHLTVGRFVRNLGAAVAHHGVRIPPVPSDAAAGCSG